MKRFIILSLMMIAILKGNAQIQVNDTTFLFLDSLFAELPEVMISGERPVVKAQEGKLIYDLPRIIKDRAIDNAFDAMKELPGIVEQNGSLTIAGKSVHVVINGKVSTMTPEQLTSLLKTIPVSRIEKAEVMYSAPARYQVRGPMVNIILKRNTGENVQGEVFSSWQQKYFGSFEERANMLYSNPKLSTDLLYSFTYGRDLFRMDKDALHTVNGTVFPIHMKENRRSRGRGHNIRWGTDYNLSANDLLSFVYTTQLGNTDSYSDKSGTENSHDKKNGTSNLQNLKLDYTSSFGLTTGIDFTFYKTPATQHLFSALNNDTVFARYEDEQRINKWKLYATQEHQLKNNWTVNYGANYTTSVDNSFQYYYDAETGIFDPARSMKSRRKEYTINGFAGLSKNFNEHLSFDASFAAELFHTELWHEWMLYPTLNINYMPSDGNIFQLALSSDKTYPSYWEMNNSVTYMGAYTEIHGNPELKPSREYDVSLNYIRKGKYVFTAYYSHNEDYSVQTLYQRPDRLVEVYKTLNFDYRRQYGIQAVIPFSIGKWLNTRTTLVGCNTREKNSNFWNLSFDRNKFAAIGLMNNTVSISEKPNLKVNISCFYQSGAIQGIYDLNASFKMDASLQWTFANNRAQVSVKGYDLFDTSAINPEIHFDNQSVKNRFTHQTRGFGLSFSYKFGNYKEKNKEGIDTSRFK